MFNNTRQPLSEEVSEEDKKIYEEIEALIKDLPSFNPNSRKKVSENLTRNYNLKNIFYNKYSRLKSEGIKKLVIQKLESYMVNLEKHTEEGYDVVMVSKLPNRDKTQAKFVKFGTIYISRTGKYIVRDNKTVLQEGKVDTTKLNIANLEQKINQPDFKFSLLQQTSVLGHTEQEIPSLKNMYAWFLEMKMSFCTTKHEENETYEKILSTYESILKKYPKFANWLIRINYLNFLSRQDDHERCVELCNEFLKNKDTFIIEPTGRDLAKIWNILAIEYQKEGKLEKSLECITKGKEQDENYAPLHATEAHVYDNFVTIFAEKGNKNKAEQCSKKRDEAFKKATELDGDRLNRNHPETKPSQSKVTSETISQPITKTTTNITPVKQQENPWNSVNHLAKQLLLSQEGSATVPTNQQSGMTTTTTTTTHDKEQASRKPFEERYPMSIPEKYLRQSDTLELIYNKPIEKTHDSALMSTLGEEDFLKIYISSKGEEKLIFRKIYISPKGKYIFHDSKRKVHEGEIDTETLKKIDQPDFRSSLLKQISRAHSPTSQDESKTDVQDSKTNVTGLNSEAKPRAQNGLSANSSTFTPRAQNGLSANGGTFIPRAQNGLSANAGIFTPRVLSANASVVAKDHKEPEANDQTSQQGHLKK